MSSIEKYIWNLINICLLIEIDLNKFKDKIIYKVIDRDPPGIETIYKEDDDQVDTRGQKLVRNSNKREHHQRTMALECLI